MAFRHFVQSIFTRLKDLGSFCSRKSAQQKRGLALIEATRQADLAKLQKLKRKRVDFSLLASLYGSVLHTAYRLSDGHADVMRFYLEQDPQFHQKDHAGHTLLDTAVIEGRLDLCRLLVTYGNPVVVSDPDCDSTPVQKAIRYHQEQILMYFITYFDNHDKLRGLITDVLKEAVLADQLEVVNLLLPYELDLVRTYENGASLLHLVQSKAIMEKLIFRGFDLNQLDEFGVSVIAKTVLENQEALASCVLEYDPDVSQGVGTFPNLLMAAAKNNNLNLLDALLRHEPNSSLRSPDANFRSWILSFCVEDRCSLEVIRFFMHHGAKLDGGNVRMETPLIIAAQKNDQYYLRFFLKAGANANAIDLEGKNALMHAIINRSEKCVMPLLSHTSNLFSDDKKGHDVIIHCARHGNELIAKLLMAKGIGFSRLGENRQTMLMLAAANNNIEMVSFLQQAGVSLEAVDGRGQTALMYAIQSDAKDAASLLLTLGADPMHQDNKGNSAQSLAENTNLVQLFRVAKSPAVIENYDPTN